MFLVTTPQEMQARGWDQLDIILVTGDAYIDSSYVGVAVIGQYLTSLGYRVGVIGQPGLESPDDITRLKAPRLFWGVSGGCIDSMVANYTATLKRRRSDDYTPGGLNDKRPDRAVLAYTNLIRRFCKPNVPIVLGGLEASLRRIAHYDYWSDSIRRSILLDAKADILSYGMGENSMRELAECLNEGRDWRQIRGLCYLAKETPVGYIELPSYETVRQDPACFTEMFKTFYANTDALTARGLSQRHGERWLVQNPPALALTPAELDRVHELSYEQAVHPYYLAQGPVKAIETIRFGLTTHRGCYGECNFCAIAAHQGRTIVSRSEASIVREASGFKNHKNFKGIIPDVGGPSANMYQLDCRRKALKGACPDKRCLFPERCRQLSCDHAPQLKLLKKLRELPGVKRVFVASGLRVDLFDEHSDAYLKELITHHVSGQLKLAPEHCVESVLNLMGKPGNSSLLRFKQRFEQISREAGKPQFLSYYFIAAHPGCDESCMQAARSFASRELGLIPEQVQVFTPLPSTWSAVMYHTGCNPFTGERLFVEKNQHRKQKQKDILTAKPEPTSSRVAPEPKMGYRTRHARPKR